MAFDKLADTIIRHNKAIIALWIVILVVATPFAIKGFDVLVYDTNQMANDDSESMVGMSIMGKEFYQDGSDMSSIPILVIQYEGEAGAQAANDLITDLNANASTYKTSDGVQKLSTEMLPFQKYDVGTEGANVLLGVVVYNNALTKDNASFISDDTKNLRDYIAQYTDGLDNVTVYVTGTPAITYDTMAGAMSDISKIDPFTILLILVLVGLFFRSFITSATPPLVIGVAFIISMALFFFIGQVMDIFFITQIILLVAMMGAGCDYCIFIIARYREERKDGKDHEAALHEAIRWGGESIAISGASVIIGFGAMAICSIDMISAMGLCLALGILIALLAALTFIPAILARTQDRIFWPTKMDSYEEGGKATRGWFAWFAKHGHTYFDKSARFSIKHAKAITAVAILVTVPAAYVTLTSETSYDMIGAMQNGDSGTGMDIVSEYVDQGVIMPNYTVIQYDQPIAVVKEIEGTGMYGLFWTEYWDNEGGVRDQLSTLSSNIIEKDGGKDGNIGAIVTPFEWEKAVEEAYKVLGEKAIDPSLVIQHVITHADSLTIQTVLATALPMMVEQYTEMIKLTNPTMSDADAALAAQTMVVGTAGPIIDLNVNKQCRLLGGTFSNSTTAGDATYVSLVMSTHQAAMAPRSMESIDNMSKVVDEYKSNNDSVVKGVWVTGTAAVMYDVSQQVSAEFNTIEVVVVVAILVLLFVVMRSYTIPFRSILTILMSICWTLAITHIVFVDLLGAEVIWMIPLILLVICLGLGMDYDILLTTRIKENVRSKGMTNDEAIYHAVTHTGSVITICGLIMGGAFGTMMLSSMVMLQEFGFALCFAILVDALIVRTYIVPAVMHLLGDWNWKGPGYKKSVGSDYENKENVE